MSREHFIETARSAVAGKMNAPIIVEGWSPDPAIQAKWERWGYVCLFPMNEHGLFHYPDGEVISTQMFDNSTVPGQIIMNIVEAVGDGKLSSEVCLEAAHEIQSGTFQVERWVNVVPRQED